MIEELRKELKDQIEENKELLKINEEHKKLNGELRKENDALITVIDLMKKYVEDNRLYDVNENCVNEILLEILERVNESEGD